jgi:hypothetical protein
MICKTGEFYLVNRILRGLKCFIFESRATPSLNRILSLSHHKKLQPHIHTMAPRRTRQRQPLHEVGPKLIIAIRQKDMYGFFSEPVDTKLVADYSTVIKNPMDLGTMLKKAQNRVYRDIQQLEVRTSL